MKIEVIKRPLHEDEFNILDYTCKSKGLDVAKALTSGSKFVLQVDGGGILGILPLYILLATEQHLGIDWRKVFKVFWGTSIGSVIACGIAAGIPVRRILEILVELGPIIFHDRSAVGKLFRRSLYKEDKMKSLLKREFKDQTLKELYQATGFEVNIAVVECLSYKTIIVNHNNFPDMMLRTLIRSSTAAPIFFMPEVYKQPLVAEDNDYLCLRDGGTGTYNCLLEQAYQKELLDGVPADKVFITSLGCGYVDNAVPNSKENCDKEVKSSKVEEALDTFMFGRAETITRQEISFTNFKKAGLTSGLRWNPTLPEGLDRMDKTDNIDNLISHLEKTA